MEPAKETGIGRVAVTGRIHHRRRKGITGMKVKFNPREDYYARLNLPPTAALNDIKRAYRRLALKTHPDVSKAPNAAESFKKVCEAYKVLSDADARRQYDMMRGGGGGGYWGGGGASSSSSSSSSRGREAGGGGRTSRQWYEQYNRYGGETADSINDSFSKIFNDFVGTVASKGGRGIFEDFVEFLEGNVDGFGAESDAEFEELLRTEDLEEIQAEVENLSFLILKLREKLQRAQLDKMMVESELRTISAAAARDIVAVDKRLEVVEKAAAMKARVTDLEGHIKRADKRQRRLMLRAEELRWGPGGTRKAYEKYSNPRAQGSASNRSNTAGGGSSSSRSSSTSSSSAGGGAEGGAGGGSRRASVEEELARLKKEMGL